MRRYILEKYYGIIVSEMRVAAFNRSAPEYYTVLAPVITKFSRRYHIMTTFKYVFLDNLYLSKITLKIYLFYFFQTMEEDVKKIMADIAKK